MRTTPLRGLMVALRWNRLVIAGAAMVSALLLLALTAPLLTRLHFLASPSQQDQRGLDSDGMPLGTGGSFRLGTDNLGRDVLSRVIHATRISLPIAFGSMLTATFIGTLVGLFAGF